MTEMTVAGLVLVLFACSWPASEAASYDARTFPNPILKPTACGMGRNESFVCDPDKILQPLQAEQLNNLIASKTKSFRCTCKESCTSYKDKYAMMVAIVKRVKIAAHNASMEEKKFAVDQFAKDLQERGWAGGNCQNDIVIVLSTEYKRISVRVGNEGKKVLSDGCIAKAIEVTKSGLTYGRYDRVLKNLVIFLSEKIDEKCADLPYGKVTRPGPTEQKFIFPFWGIILIVVVVVSIAMGVCLWSFKRKHRREAARLYHVSDHPQHEPGKKGSAAGAEGKTLMSHPK